MNEPEDHFTASAHRVKSAIVASLCAILIVLPLVAAPFARSLAWSSVASQDAEEPWAVSTGAEAEEGAPKPEGLGVRELPVLSPDLDSAIGDVPDRAFVHAQILGLIEQTDLTSAGLLLAQSLDTTGKLSLYSELAVSRISEEAIREHASQLVDLASLLSIESYAKAPTWSSPSLAILLSRRIAEHVDTCEAQLNYAYLRSLPHSMPPLSLDEDAVQAERAAQVAQFERAAATCGDDPTALFTLGMFQVAWPQERLACSQSEGALTVVTQDDLADARNTFERLVADHPDSPTGYLGLAEIASAVAGSGDKWVTRPFSARVAWKEALEHLSTARLYTSDKAVLVLQARALCMTGRCEEAANLLDQAGEIPSDGAWPDIVAGIYYGAGRTEDILALERAPMTSAARQFVPKILHHFFWGSTIWGLHSKEVGYINCGGATASNLGFLSNSQIQLLKSDSLESFQSWVVAIGRTDDEIIAGCASGGGKLAEPCIDSIVRLRNSGHTDRAERIARAWVELSDGVRSDSFLAYDHLGLVLLSAEKYDDAAAAFALALDRKQQPNLNPSGYLNNHEDIDTPRERILLREAYALNKAARPDEAEMILDEIRDTTSEGDSQYSRQVYWHNLYYTQLQLSDLFIQQERYEEALDALNSANAALDLRLWNTTHNGEEGVAANNTALVAIQVGDYGLALEKASAAVRADPASPVYLQTLADAKRHHAAQSGDTVTGNSCGLDDAIAVYEAALAADESSSVGWNNLGVVQAECGYRAAAAESFRNAVRASPDYAQAWFNYGSFLLVDGDWSEFLIAEGALGVAGGLDPSLRDLAPTLEADDYIYDSGLDLSQALPDEWKLGQHERRSAAPLTVLLLVVLLMRIVQAFITDRVSSEVAQAAMTGALSRPVSIRLPLIVGLVLSSALLVLLGPAESRERLVLAPIAVAAATLPTAFRRLRPLTENERVPLAMLATSALLMPLGVAVPPLPGGTAKSKATLAPIALGCLVLAAASTGFIAPIPLAHTTLLTLVAVLTTTLLPLPPYDGSQLGPIPSRLATVGLGILTIASVVGWL